MAKEIIKKYSIILKLAVFLFAIFVSIPATASAAADLTLSPLSGVIIQGTSLSVDVLVTNNTQAINAVSGTITYPTDLLSVKSISKDGSIVKMWAEEPTSSNTEGKVSFEGVIFNPGFSGSRGKILRIVFTAKRTGKADVLFASGSVLANDGNATNVLGQLGSASFTVDANAQVTNGDTTTPAVPASANTDTKENPLVPIAPNIQSATNPDPNKWYNKDQPSFTWQVPADVTAIKALYDDSPSSLPTHVYQPAISNKELGVVDDGVHYFHVQFKNAHGWGPVSHFRFQTDTKAPSPFSITFPYGNETDNPSPVLDFKSVDSVSGIDHYEIRIDNGDPISFVQEKASTIFAMPVQVPGKHTILIKALDKAGNATVQSADFTVDAIDSPKITEYPQELEVDQLLQIKGTSYPNATVSIYLKDKDGKIDSQSADTEASGAFTLSWTKRVDTGTYVMSAVVTDKRGAKSLPTNPVTIVVKSKAIFRIGSIVIDYVAIAIMIFTALAGLIAFGWFLASRLRHLRKRISRDVSDTQTALHEKLRALKEDLEEHVELLEGAKNDRGLTKEENIILKSLDKKIDMIEKDLSKRLDGMKRGSK